MLYHFKFNGSQHTPSLSCTCSLTLLSSSSSISMLPTLLDGCSCFDKVEKTFKGKICIQSDQLGQTVCLPHLSATTQYTILSIMNNILFLLPYLWFYLPLKCSYIADFLLSFELSINRNWWNPVGDQVPHLTVQYSHFQGANFYYLTSSMPYQVSIVSFDVRLWS